MPLSSRAISHARGHLRVSRFARRTAEKRETARSLNCSPSSLAADGKAGQGLKLEKILLAIWLQKITEKLLRLVLPHEICLISPFLTL